MQTTKPLMPENFIIKGFAYAKRMGIDDDINQPDYYEKYFREFELKKRPDYSFGISLRFYNKETSMLLATCNFEIDYDTKIGQILSLKRLTDIKTYPFVHILHRRALQLMDKHGVEKCELTVWDKDTGKLYKYYYDIGYRCVKDKFYSDFTNVANSQKLCYKMVLDHLWDGIVKLGVLVRNGLNEPKKESIEEKKVEEKKCDISTIIDVDVDAIKCIFVNFYSLYLKRYHKDILKQVSNKTIAFFATIGQGGGDIMASINIVTILSKTWKKIKFIVTFTNKNKAQEALFNASIKHFADIEIQEIPYRMIGDRGFSNAYKEHPMYDNRNEILIFGPMILCDSFYSTYALPIKEKNKNAVIIGLNEGGFDTISADEDYLIDKNVAIDCRSIGFSFYDLGLVITDYSNIESYQIKDNYFIFNYIRDSVSLVIMQELLIILYSNRYTEQNTTILTNMTLESLNDIKLLLQNPVFKNFQIIYEDAIHLKLMWNETQKTIDLIFESKNMSHETFLSHIKGSHLVCGCTGDGSFMEVISAKKYPVYDLIFHKRKFYYSFLELLRTYDSFNIRKYQSYLDIMTFFYMLKNTKSDDLAKIDLSFVINSVKKIFDDKNVLNMLYNQNIFETYYNLENSLPYYIASFFNKQHLQIYDNHFLQIWKEHLLKQQIDKYSIAQCQVLRKQEKPIEGCSIL